VTWCNATNSSYHSGSCDLWILTCGQTPHEHEPGAGSRCYALNGDLTCSTVPHEHSDHEPCRILTYSCGGS
jgi:hypothetical protein